MDPASATVAGVSIVLAITALVISIRQYHLAEDQTMLTRTQARIAEEQQAFVKAELARKSALSARLNRESVMGGTHQVRFGIHNSGDKSARGVYWSIYMPLNIGDYNIYFQNVKPDTIRVVVDNRPYDKYSGYLESPVFPTKTLQFGTLSIWAEHFETVPRIDILWHLTGEDGVFPERTKAGQLALTFSEPAMDI